MNHTEAFQMNDKVPEQWKGLFTNEEWLQHQLIVKGSWLFFILAFINHAIVSVGVKQHIKP
jgi:hypothetical protein